MKRAVPHRIHFDELRAALEHVLSHYSKGRRRIKSFRRRRSVYSSSYPIENIEVELDRGQKVRLVLKDLSPASLLLTAQQVRPHFLYEPWREIETYKKILDPKRLGTPICYGAINEPELERYWLFLERVNGPLLWQMGRMESWEQAARWLASLHNEFDTANRPQNETRMAHLLRYDEHFFSVWLSRAEEFLRHKYAADSTDSLRRFRRLADRYDRVIKRLLDLPTTFVHGEFYPSNVIMRRTKKGRQICPIDWELAAIAPGLIDLAALTSGDWTEDKKKRMAAAYRDALEPSQGGRASLADLTEAVDHCQLHLCVQMLGWASDWSPPEEHAQNWLRHALRLAERLGM